MTCSVVLSGQIVVGADSCGCATEGGSQKILPLALGRATFATVQSTDCAVPIQAVGVWVPLPAGGLLSTELLVVTSTGTGSLRWGGAVGALTGTELLGSVTFVGTETLGLVIDSTAFTVAFTAGSKTITQIAALINAAAMVAGMLFLPASVLASSSKILLSGQIRSLASGVSVTAALASVGFPAVVAASGTDPQVVALGGLFINQWPAGGGVSDLEVTGSLSLTVLSAGTA